MGGPGCDGCVSGALCMAGYRGRNSGNLDGTISLDNFFYTDHQVNDLCSGIAKIEDYNPERVEFLNGNYYETSTCISGTTYVKISYRTHSRDKSDPIHGWGSDIDTYIDINLFYESTYRLHTKDPGLCDGGCDRAPSTRSIDFLP